MKRDINLNMGYNQSLTLPSALLCGEIPTLSAAF